MKLYYDTRAPEYDDWYLGQGLFARRERPGWDDAVESLQQTLEDLPQKKTLDVACGTGFLTEHLRGEITGLDASARMLQIARERVPHAIFVQGDAIQIPFKEGEFERVFTGHFYGHLQAGERAAFLAEAHRLAPELIVVDSAVRPDHKREEWQTRLLSDGSSFSVYKRYFDAAELVRELEDRPADDLAEDTAVLHESDWFVAVLTRS